jgi:hypothetical protein
MQRLAKEMMPSKDSKMIDRAYAVARETNKPASGKVIRLQRRFEITLDGSAVGKPELDPTSR